MSWFWKQRSNGSLALVSHDSKKTAVLIDKEGSIGLRYADVTLTAAQLKALNATPRTLVAAPGADYANVFEGAIAFLDFGTAAYDGIAAGEDLSIKYTDGSGAEVAQCEATGFLDQGADTVRYIRPGATAIAPVANAALVLHMLTGEIATGDSLLKLRIFYRVIPTTLP